MTIKTEIPNDWIRTTLRNHLAICRNGLVCPQDADGPSAIPITRIETISEGRIDWDRVGFVSPEDTNPAYLLRKGDILLSHINSVKHIGKVARVTDNRPLLHGMNLMALRCAESLDIEFGFFLMAWEQTKRYMERRAKKAVNQASINRQDIFDLPILLPPLPEQRAIAAVLDSIDDSIERTDAVIEATEQLRDSLLHELLTRGVPGWHTAWKDVTGLGAIPADWEVVRLGEVAEVQTGRAVNRKAAHGHTLEIPYLSVANVKDGYLDLGTVKTMQVDGSEVDRYRLLAGDVLFTEGGDADKLGRGTVWKEEIPLCLHQNHIFVVRPDLHFLCAEFLSFYATSSFGKRYFLGAAKQTTNLASINSTQLRQMPLPLPSVREQEELVALLSAVGVFAQQASNEHDSLQSLKNSTANALLAGRLRVGLSSTGTTPPGQAEAGVLADG